VKGEVLKLCGGLFTGNKLKYGYIKYDHNNLRIYNFSNNPLMLHGTQLIRYQLRILY